MILSIIVWELLSGFTPKMNDTIYIVGDWHSTDLQDLNSVGMFMFTCDFFDKSFSLLNTPCEGRYFAYLALNSTFFVLFKEPIEGELSWV